MTIRNGEGAYDAEDRDGHGKPRLAGRAQRLYGYVTDAAEHLAWRRRGCGGRGGAWSDSGQCRAGSGHRRCRGSGWWLSLRQKQGKPAECLPTRLSGRPTESLERSRRERPTSRVAPCGRATVLTPSVPALAPWLAASPARPWAAVPRPPLAPASPAGISGPPAAITGFFTVRRVPWIMLWTVFSVFINENKWLCDIYRLRAWRHSSA